MSKYIKTFDTLQEYQEYSGSTAFTSPNVSYVKANDTTYYDNNEIKHYTEQTWLKTIDESEYTATTFSLASAIKEVDIPSSVTSIGANSFDGCTSLTSVTIPSSVTTIGYYAFENCTSLTSVTIPSSVREIGDFAFFYCTSLTNITIPNSVTRIRTEAFRGCTALASVTVEATTPPTLYRDAFLSTNNCPIYVPSESVETYKTATNWSTYADRIQAIS